MRVGIVGSGKSHACVRTHFIKEYEAHGYTGQVIDLVQENFKMFDHDAETLNLMAEALFKRGKKERAREVWKYILSIEPKNINALRGMMTP